MYPLSSYASHNTVFLPPFDVEPAAIARSRPATAPETPAAEAATAAPLYPTEGPGPTLDAPAAGAPPLTDAERIRAAAVRRLTGVLSEEGRWRWSSRGHSSRQPAKLVQISLAKANMQSKDPDNMKLALFNLRALVIDEHQNAYQPELAAVQQTIDHTAWTQKDVHLRRSTSCLLMCLVNRGYVPSYALTLALATEAIEGPGIAAAQQTMQNPEATDEQLWSASFRIEEQENAYMHLEQLVDKRDELSYPLALRTAVLWMSHPDPKKKEKAYTFLNSLVRARYAPAYPVAFNTFQEQTALIRKETETLAIIPLDTEETRAAAAAAAERIEDARKASYDLLKNLVCARHTPAYRPALEMAEAYMARQEAASGFALFQACITAGVKTSDLKAFTAAEQALNGTNRSLAIATLRHLVREGCMIPGIKALIQTLDPKEKSADLDLLREEFAFQNDLARILPLSTDFIPLVTQFLRKPV